MDIYQLGLTMIPGVGNVLGKKLVAICGSAEAVFREQRQILRRFPRVGELLAASVGNREILERAEQEMGYMERAGVRALFYQDSEYPRRLKQCSDGPMVLFYKGTADLNPSRVISIVGTRSATDYGRSVVRGIVEGLAHHKVQVVSGLAYGIDGCAHRVALDCGLNTVGVLGHGLDRVYPFAHLSLAQRMVLQGGMVTEFLSGSRPDRENFPMRNRIIAGMADAVIVVEAAVKGGALITADLANSYNRDVFAVPGRTTDPFSEGTNLLIRTNRAALIQKPADVEYMMGWIEQEGSRAPAQKRLFIELTPEEEQITGLLSQRGETSIDEISIQTSISMSRVSAALLNLEFEGVVSCLPGKVYRLL